MNNDHIKNAKMKVIDVHIGAKNNNNFYFILGIYGSRLNCFDE